MQTEINSTHPNLDIELFAINMIGTGAGTSYFSTSLNLPMVQDSSSLEIWDDWGALWRDVFILNENNELVLTYNLTQNNLSNSSNYNTLMQYFVDTASP